MSIVEKQVLEVSLIGTGGGYGESIVVHLSNNEWVVIDSCIDPINKTCLPLEFLESRNVDLATQVKLIVCTHWHDDHIKGISELLKKCLSSEFAMAPCSDTKKFLQLLKLDYAKVKSNATIASTIELNKCIEIIVERQIIVKKAIQDRILFASNLNNVDVKIFSLTPSDFVLEEFDNEISSLMNEFCASNRKIHNLSPNDKSVVILISINEINILLGSDLEVSEDSKRGWLCILENSQIIKERKSNLFKIPHHGSKNGYHERIWSELLSETCVAKMTPWNLGSKLPKADMLMKFLEHTEKLFITSLPPTHSSAKKRSKSISKAIKEFNPTLQEVKYKLGIVKCSIDLSKNDSNWNIELIGEAKLINRSLIE